MVNLRRQVWWLFPELVVVMMLAAGMTLLRSDAFHEELSNRAQAALELLPPAELELRDKHGHLAGHGAKVICAAESFGTDPAGAERLEDVRVIYAHYLCALVESGTQWDFASRSSGPAVITLTDPPTVRIAQSGEGFPDRVRAMMPDNLESRSFAGFRDRDRPSALLVRYNAEAF